MANDATTGSWTAQGTVIDGNRAGLVHGAIPFQAPTVATLGANGVVTLADPLGTLEMAFSANGRYWVGRIPDATTNLFFGTRQAAAAGVFGAATAGTGAVAPRLGMRGYPVLGNGNWRWAITAGRGGAASVLAIGFLRSAGLPFAGGSLWLDPAGIVASAFLPLGGATGAAGAGDAELALPIPTDPSFVGVVFHGQAFVLDPAAAGGAAMSRGFTVVLDR